MNLFNFFGKGPSEHPQPTGSEKLELSREASFNKLSALLSPSIIAEIRSQFTSTNAAQEGFQTTKMDRTEEFAKVLEVTLRATVAMTEQKLGVSLTDRPEFEKWLTRTAFRDGHELSEMIYSLAPSVDKKPSPKQQLLQIVTSSPEILPAFNEWKSHYNYCGARERYFVNREQPDNYLELELSSVLCAVIASRAIGKVSPLTFSEFQNAAETNRAIE